MKLAHHRPELRKIIWLMAVLLLTTLGYAQDRLVLPGQELFYPNLTDPSFTGEGNRTQITALGQFMDFNTDRATQYVNAQLPLYDNLSFGVDYFNNTFDFLNYSQALLSAAYKVPVGTDGYVKIGLAGGVDSFRTDLVPLSQQGAGIIPNINENDISFTYRAGLHYTGRNLTLGASYTTLILQNAMPQTGLGDALSYKLSSGYTGYLGYRIGLGERFALTPMFRYLSFTDDAIYEGSVKLQLKDRFDISLAYRNDYSINPALRVILMKSLALGYSYEMAMGNLFFEDIHSFSLSYQFKKGNGQEEPEWMENAKDNIAKIDAIKEKKKKPKPAKEVPLEIVEVVVPEERSEPEGIPQTQNGAEQEKEIVAPKRAVVIVMSPRYYVIANDFTTYQDAYVFKETLQQNGLNATIGNRAGDPKFYVYIDSNSNKARAAERLSKYGKNPFLKAPYLLQVE